ncbi:3-phenylpropionate dioxygenase [Limnohabitans sp. JirII-29]|uniref:aromatic ring-hydroxylating oxygenase subunit alpha n=1 Tax=unclassified Limnohabitans TaxID=2626134 RepID=UPI000C1EB283|nr:MULTISPECIES: aromatic ring-hydroxylating dioxygenase subunit alpha [unclassified Limnohabitans]PIT72550.1 3-phenylpropionate dioxygenase [Limnohabitans sp. JirII-31]PUE29201.1 3-phenylpropionate dioxygenase [Limnohabitans sp. JirII-29]
MNTSVMHFQADPTEAVLAEGLKDLWYPVCPSTFVKESPVSLRRLGYKIVLWRDQAGKVHALEDHCPHRGAPLSLGVILGDRIACPYHGVEVRCDGTVTRVPGSPGCKLEGSRQTRTFHTAESNGAIFLFNALDPQLETPPPLRLPEQLSSPEWSTFICYTEWGCDYRYVMENVIDPMHGAYLHKQSHTMADGELTADFQIRPTDEGFFFEKKGQRNVNFDWTEWMANDAHWMRLEIPYPKTGGPGGSFTIIGSYVPITRDAAGIFFWRCRKVSGWQRNAWRFLYKNRLEARHWQVLEQDRVAMEHMEPDANQREHLYQHDMGIVRLRRTLKTLAQQQLDKAAAQKA